MTLEDIVKGFNSNVQGMAKNVQGLLGGAGQAISNAPINPIAGARSIANIAQNVSQAYNQSPLSPVGQFNALNTQVIKPVQNYFNPNLQGSLGNKISSLPINPYQGFESAKNLVQGFAGEYQNPSGEGFMVKSPTPYQPQNFEQKLGQQALQLLSGTVATGMGNSINKQFEYGGQALSPYLTKATAPAIDFLTSIPPKIKGKISNMLSQKIEPSVVQIVDTVNNKKYYKIIPKGQLEDFKALIDNQGGIAGKNINGKITHITAKTPAQMEEMGFINAGTAELPPRGGPNIPSPVAPQQLNQEVIIKQSAKGNIYIKSGNEVLADVPKTIQSDIYEASLGNIPSVDRRIKANVYLNRKGFEMGPDGRISKTSTPVKPPTQVGESLQTPQTLGELTQTGYKLGRPELKGKLSGEDALIQAGLDSGWDGLLKSGQTDVSKLTQAERDYLLKSATSYVGAGDPVIIERANSYVKSAPLNQGGGTLYHGTNSIADFEKFNPEFGGKGVGTNIINQGNNFYLTENKDIAKIFSTIAEDKRKLSLPLNQKIKTGIPGNVLDFKLKPNSRVKIVNYEDVVNPKIAQETINKAKEEGYSAIKFEDKAWQGWDGYGADKIYELKQKTGKFPDTTIVIDQNAVERVFPLNQEVKTPIETPQTPGPIQPVEPTPLIGNTEPLPWETNVPGELKTPSQELPTGKVETPVGVGSASTLDQSRILEQKAIQETPQIGQQSFENIVTQSVPNAEVKKKVNILDYIRTPDRVLEKIGLGQQAKQIRTAYEGYLRQLPKEIDKITTWSKEVPPESNQRIFQYLDGKPIELNPTEMKVATEVKSYLADWAKKLGLPQEKQISNYITHIFPKGMEGKEFDPEIAKLIQENVAGSVYDPFLQKRTGALGYKEDTWAALDAYVKRATRKVNMDPALDAIKDAADRLPIESYNYVKHYVDNVNMRPSNIETLIDNFIKSTPVGYQLGQRPFTAVTQKARQMIYRGTLGLNPGSALKNLSQGVNTYAKLGEKYTLQGYMDMAKNFRSSELEDVGVLSNDLIQDRSLSATKKMAEKFDKGLFFMFEQAEKINRGAAYYGAKAKALAEGKSPEQAIDYAKKLVRDTQFSFGSIDTPVALQGDVAKTLAQFQSFNIKQGEFLGEMLKNKEWAGLARYVGASLVFIGTIGQALGMKPQDMIPSVKVGGSPLFTLGGDVASTITGGRDQYGNTPSLGGRLKTLGNDLIPFIPAGVELKKLSKGKILSGVSAPSFSVGNLPGPEPVSAAEYPQGQSNRPISPLEKYRLQQQVSDLSKQEKDILSQGSGVELPFLGNVGGMSDSQKMSQLDQIAQQKKMLNYQINKENIQQRVEDQNYSLETDRMSRTNNFKGWVDTTQNYIDTLKQRQQSLDPITQADKIISLQNKIEDTQTKLSKYKGQGGFTKPKKPKSLPKSKSFKIPSFKMAKVTKMKMPNLVSKSSTIPFTSLKKSKTVSLKVPKGRRKPIRLV